jgi:Zn-dependent protease with chaperone function
MKRGWTSLLVVVVCVRMASAAPADENERQLRADPHVTVEMLETYQLAKAAWEAGRFDDAVEGFRRLAVMAPTSDLGHRGACASLLQTDRVAEMVAECEAAVALSPASVNTARLAIALVRSGRPGELARAEQLAHAVRVEVPADAVALGLACIVLEQARSVELSACAEQLLANDPRSQEANYLGTEAAANKGEFDVARERLARAHAAGLPEAEYRAALAEIERLDRPAPRSAMRRMLDALLWTLWLFVPWLVIMALLVVVGRALSGVALRALDHPETLAPNVRRWSRIVLGASGIYFYVSLPILLLLVVVSAALVVAAFLFVGQIPLIVPIAAVAAVLTTFGGVTYALFVRPSFTDLGRPLDLDEHPRLRALLAEVASAVGTRPPDSVYLTPGTMVGVEERAGLWRSVRHADIERRLIIGVGLFDGMTQLQLRAILAHEHGHYRNEDTAGGGFALRVRHSVRGLVTQLARSRYAAANPAWWFLQGYMRIYYGISQGASRVQEVLADRWAIRAYGSKAFVDGYRHVALRTIEFAYRTEAVVLEAHRLEIRLTNLYQYELDSGQIRETDRDAEVEAEMSREPAWHDSHPSSKQRIAWAEAMSVAREPQPDDDAPVWDLFTDRDAIEEELTGELSKQIRVVAA